MGKTENNGASKDEGEMQLDAHIRLRHTGVWKYGGDFSACLKSITSIVVEDGVTSIGDYAFDHCIGLTTVTIGYNVTNIGEYAFNSCTSLVTVDIPAKVTNITVKAFAGCTDLATVTLNSNPFIAADALPTGAAVTMNLTANPAGGAYWMTFYNHNFTFEADANTQVLKAALNGQDLEVTELTTDQTVTKQNAVILKSTSANVTLTRSLTANGWNTFAVPFDISNSLIFVMKMISGIYIQNGKKVIK